MPPAISNAELGRRIDAIATTLEALPDKLAETYVRQDLHNVIHDYQNGRIERIEKQLKDTESERVTARRFRVGVIATGFASLLGLVGVLINIH